MRAIPPNGYYRSEFASGETGQAPWTAPFYGWFTEGFDTADLKDAKALLDQLL